MKWIKATDRLPELNSKQKFYACKITYKSGEIFKYGEMITINKIFVDQIPVNETDVEFLSTIEWLDESEN